MRGADREGSKRQANSWPSSRVLPAFLLSETKARPKPGSQQRSALPRLVKDITTQCQCDTCQSWADGLKPRPSAASPSAVHQ